VAIGCVGRPTIVQQIEGVFDPVRAVIELGLDVIALRAVRD